MKTDIQEHKVKEKTLAVRLREKTGESVSNCYQCGKCSAGCPLADNMDYTPSQILRMLQLDLPELEEKVLRSETIWLCLTCQTCFARCPKEVDLPRIMDFLREVSLKEGKTHPSAKDIIAFHRAFLTSIKQTGRLYEISLIANFKARAFRPFQDVALAPKMLLRGKLSLLPHLIRDRKKFARLFEKTIQTGKEDKS